MKHEAFMVRAKAATFSITAILSPRPEHNFRLYLTSLSLSLADCGATGEVDLIATAGGTAVPLAENSLNDVVV
jgi:hypothetical protein